MELIVLAGEREEKVRVRRDGDAYEVTLGETRYRVDSLLTHRGKGADLLSLRLDGGGRHGEQHEVAVRSEKGNPNGRYHVSRGSVSILVEVFDPLSHLARVAHAGRGSQGIRQVTAYMPGKVVALLVEEGAEVAAGQGVLVLEAMKMENEIQAEGGGVVRRILVQAGQAVEGGDPLFEIE